MSASTIALIKRYALPFCAVYALNLIVYSYLYTTIVFTNHTLPNAWMYGYPSFKTHHEGRWFADILIQLTGGSGVQSLQMALGSAIVVINGFIFAEILRIRNIFHVAIISAFLSLHPAILDYYSFTVDHISFAFGDTLGLLATFALIRIRDPKQSLPIAVTAFVLMLATYQPKIGLMGVLLIIWCIDVFSKVDRAHTQQLAHEIVLRIFQALTVFLCALAIYYLSVRLTARLGGDARNHVNSLKEAWQQVLAAYPNTLSHTFYRVDYLPRALAFLPAAGAILGIIALLRSAYAIHKPLIVIMAFLLSLFPVAINLVYIVNDQTWRNAGRVLAPEAYFLLFLLISGWSFRHIRPVISIVFGIIIWQFAILGSQQVNAAAMKTVFDLAKINRIVSRIEDVALPNTSMPLVVFGDLPLSSDRQRFKKVPNSIYGAQILTEAFVGYRQVDILNFFIGREAVASPTEAQVRSAWANRSSRKSWPAPGSVYVQDGMLVVWLDQASEEEDHTATR